VFCLVTATRWRRLLSAVCACWTRQSHNVTVIDSIEDVVPPPAAAAEERKTRCVFDHVDHTLLNMLQCMVVQIGLASGGSRIFFRGGG